MGGAVSGGGSNLTLTAAQLAECSPVGGCRIVRAYCPIHGSDHTRSLRVNLETGHFRCFQCGAWGYMEEARGRRKEDRARGGSPAARATPASRTPPTQPSPVRPDLEALVAGFAAALPGSPGEEYLARRRITARVARGCRIGYATRERWAAVGRRTPHGRIVVPHTSPDGTLVSLYGRAVETAGPVPKGARHDHLAGNKGFFNAAALRRPRVWICEGAFDALSLIARGVGAACAIFGVEGWRWEWAGVVREMVFAFDLDAAGARWKAIARDARLRGIAVEVLDASCYGGSKDVAAAWADGVLTLPDGPELIAIEAFEERAAILEYEGGFAREEAERLAARGGMK